MKRNTCLFLSLALVLAVNVLGCKFFGKEADAPAPAPGTLSGGASIVGTWTVSSSPTSATSTPTYAATSTYVFEPTGVVQVTAHDSLGSGTTCTGYGQYRAVGSNGVIVYIQAANPPTCAFAAQVQMSNIQVLAKSLKFTDPVTNQTYSYFIDNTQALAPVGVWKFNGAGGIDYLFIDPHGYFVMQITDTGTQYLLIGYYTVAADGTLTLAYFNNMDPTRVVGTLVFNQYLTDGTGLQLIQQTSTGTHTYTGAKL